MKTYSISFIGTCSYTDCERKEWSSWSTDCGNGNRTRTITPVKKTIEKYSCDGLSQSCPQTSESEDRSELCKLKFFLYMLSLTLNGSV